MNQIHQAFGGWGFCCGKVVRVLNLRSRGHRFKPHLLHQWKLKAVVDLLLYQSTVFLTVCLYKWKVRESLILWKCRSNFGAILIFLTFQTLLKPWNLKLSFQKYICRSQNISYLMLKVEWWNCACKIIFEKREFIIEDKYFIVIWLDLYVLQSEFRETGKTDLQIFCYSFQSTITDKHFNLFDCVSLIDSQWAWLCKYALINQKLVNYQVIAHLLFITSKSIVI